jgi:hypothetical protein
MSNVLEVKDPNVPATYSIDWIDELVDEASRETEFSLGTIVQAQRDTGWYYECTTAGRTSAHYPQWPRLAGETVADVSIVWTARHPDDVTTTEVQSATWAVPAGLTLVSQSQTGLVTQITVSGGVDGVDYEVTCAMTPTVGAAREQTIVIPVRER